MATSEKFAKKEQTDNIISVLVFLLCFTVLAGSIWMFQKNVVIITQIITAVISVLSTMVGFRWGNSRNSNRKDETIDQLVNPQPGQTVLTTTTDKPPDMENKT